MSPTRHLLTVAGSLLCAASLQAENAAPAKPADAPAMAAPAPAPYQLKRRSSFACAAATARAPFWPIGWVHRKGVSSAVATAAVPKSVLEAASFRVTSILLGSGPAASLAVINGRAYSEGEFLKMPRGAAPAVTAAPAVPGAPAPVPAARIRVQRISDGSVVLQREDQLLTVALQRPELVLKKTDDTLLDEER